MDHQRVPRTHVHGAHPTILGDVGGRHEAAVEIVAVGRNLEIQRHSRFQVGLAELPAVAEMRRCGRGGEIARRRAFSRPMRERGDLGAGQAAFVAKVRSARQPWRHGARGGDGSDQRRAFGRVPIGEQTEWRHAAGAVTGGAPAIEDRRHVVRERHSSGTRRPKRRQQSTQVHVFMVPQRGQLARRPRHGGANQSSS